MLLHSKSLMVRFWLLPMYSTSLVENAHGWSHWAVESVTGAVAVKKKVSFLSIWTTARSVNSAIRVRLEQKAMHLFWMQRAILFIIHSSNSSTMNCRPKISVWSWIRMKIPYWPVPETTENCIPSHVQKRPGGRLLTVRMWRNFWVKVGRHRVSMYWRQSYWSLWHFFFQDLWQGVLLFRYRNSVIPWKKYRKVISAFLMLW